MHRRICLFGKLYQSVINASKNNQEGSHDRHVLKQTVLTLHSLPRTTGNTQHYILRHCLSYYPGVQPEFCKGILTICIKKQLKE